jgi:hypothetical protein
VEGWNLGRVKGHDQVRESHGYAATTLASDIKFFGKTTRSYFQHTELLPLSAYVEPFPSYRNKLARSKSQLAPVSNLKFFHDHVFRLGRTGMAAFSG